MVGVAFSNRVIRALLSEGVNGADVWVGLCLVGSQKSQEASGAGVSEGESGGTEGQTRSRGQIPQHLVVNGTFIPSEL